MRIGTPGFQLLLACCLLVTANGLLPKVVHAETRSAAGLTPEAVWEAIDAAKDGDTVELPEGTAVWKSGWNAGRWAKMKAITIQGAGIDKTVIRTDTTRNPGEKAFVINGVEGKPFRITGITFDGTGFPNAGIWAGEIVISGNCKNFRIDHCKFLNMDQMMMVFNNTITGTTYNTRTIQVSHERSFMAIGEFAVCDGTNPIDGNQIPAGQIGAGYRCLGQPGRAARIPTVTACMVLSPCYAWNNTLNGAKLNMALRPWADPQQTARQAAHVKRAGLLQRGPSQSGISRIPIRTRCKVSHDRRTKGCNVHANGACAWWASRGGCSPPTHRSTSTRPGRARRPSTARFWLPKAH